MASKMSNIDPRPTVGVASSSTLKESSPTADDKGSKKSRSISKNHDGKSRKRKKKQHKSKKNTNEKANDLPPLPPPEEKLPPPPPPPPPPLSTSQLYDDLDDKIPTSSNSFVKADVPLSHSPPPMMPTILRQGSRSAAKAQMIPPSVLRSAKQPPANHSPTSTTQLNNTEDLATKKFEEQLALLDASSSKLTMNNWDQSSGGSEEDEQIERICRMNNTGSIAGPIQFRFSRTQNLPLKNSPVSNDIGTNEEEIVPLENTRKKKRLHKLANPIDGAHSASSPDENDKNLQVKKIKTSEAETTTDTTEQAIKSLPTDENTKIEEIVASTTTTEEKANDETGKEHQNATENNEDHRRSSRSSSRSSSRGRRRQSSRRRHRRRRRRHSSSSSSRSSYTSASSDSSRSSSSRSYRKRRRDRSRSSRSSSRSSSSSSDHRRHRSSRSSSRSYSRHRSSTSRSSRSSTSSRSSYSRSRSRSHDRKSSRRSYHNQQQSNSNGKSRGATQARRGRGARNNARGRPGQSTDLSRRSTPNRNGGKYLPTLPNRKLPNNKPPRPLIIAGAKVATNEETIEENATISTATMSTGSEEVKSEPIIFTTNSNQQRPQAQKKNVKGKNKQQTAAYTLKNDTNNDMDTGDGEPMIGPKLPAKYEKKMNKESPFTPPDMTDPKDVEMLNDLQFRAELHARINHGSMSELEAQRLIDEREAQKQLAELPLIQMPIIQPALPTFGSIIVAPSPAISAYQLQISSASTSQIPTTPDASSLCMEQQQAMSPHSATSSNGDGGSTPGQTTPSGHPTILTSDGQQMMMAAGTGVNPQLVQIAQPTQQIYMPMQAAVQQPRVVAVRTAQGGIQHFIEYPTAQLLQAQQQQQQQQQPQFIQHNGQLVQVLRSPVAYSSATLMQQLQLQQQQQQQQALVAQLQAQQLAAMQQSAGAIFLQNANGQLVLAQANPQAMRVVQLPYVPK